VQVPVDVPKCLGHRAVQRAASRVPVGKQDSSANRYLLTQLKRIAHRLPTQTPHEQLMERRSNEGAGGKSVAASFLGTFGDHTYCTKADKPHVDCLPTRPLHPV
jgi:hypothetical protein